VIEREGAPTSVEFSTPISGVSGDRRTAAASAAALDPAIRRAYLVTASYPEADGTSWTQDELHFELDDPPGGGGADAERFLRVGHDLRSREGVIFTFTTLRRLTRVREVGLLVCERDEA
jgi:hypothetical protein